MRLRELRPRGLLRRLNGTRTLHHLLDLTLLLSNTLDITLEVMEAVIHGVDGLGVGVHVHGLDVRCPWGVHCGCGPIPVA